MGAKVDKKYVKKYVGNVSRSMQIRYYLPEGEFFE